MDDKTALSKDVDITAVTSDASQNEIKKPSSEPAKQKASFSFFGVSDGGNTGKLKYITNTVNESVVEDDPAFVKEKIKYGKSPIIKSKQRNGETIILIVSIIAAAIFIGGIVFALSFHSPERLSRLLSLGDKYLSELDYENAVKAYRSALAIDGENKHAYIGLTKSYMGLKDYDKALETVDMAITVLGRNDELVELRRRIFVERCGEKGLYLDDGTYVPDDGSLTLTDIKDAFLYNGPEKNTIYSGILYDDSNEPFTEERAEIKIKADTIFPFDGNTYIYYLITKHALLHGGNSCLLVDHIKDENGNSEEYKYHISYSDAEVATATEELDINKDELVDYTVYKKNEQPVENTESAEETDENTGKTIEELSETEVSEEAEVSEETEESTDDSDVNSEDNEDQQKSIESKEDLRKRVDKLLAKGDEAAAREILELMNNTDDWSYMYELPVDYPMPPRATLVRSAYKSAVYYVDKDDEYDFDLPYIWIIEDGEIIGQTLNNLDEIYEMGGFHEWWEYIENPPGAVHATGPDDE